MGWLEELTKSINNMVDEMESDTDKSRSQGFLENFWKKREELNDAKDFSYGKEKSTIQKLLNLLNRKGKENDMEPF
ncbi:MULTISPECIES: hypothetical protein [Croceibacter]|uniref:hypothetical protein n=1 Tax=Croceibacter TaxID=216431 RepID=UPI000C4103E4|nr:MULTISPECIES: hypothetical protein [Croceibacter]MBG25782.1 hypothetical protein [Croceibacter sp.]|tara:strand:- start:339 stop:566 length:228 start_codon:yes stop_codon:yes gene_type:complete